MPPIPETAVTMKALRQIDNIEMKPSQTWDALSAEVNRDWGT